jgi:NTE family protein
VVAAKIGSILEALPAADFVDGPYRVRRLVKRVIPPRRPRLADLALLPAALQAGRTLLRKGGLNGGDAFEMWLAGVLAHHFGISTIEQLRARVEGAFAADGARPPSWEDLLVLPTTALPLGIKLLLPRDLPALRVDPRMRSPAVMVRASMAVPAFFTPLEVDTAGNGWYRDLLHRIGEQISEEEVRGGESLRSLALVDGGLLSNFPVDAFHAESPSTATDGSSRAITLSLPTIGISLTNQSIVSEWRPGGLAGLLGMTAAMVGAARRVRDREARARARRRGDRLVFVDTGEHNWLDFTLTAAAQRDLFDRGYRAVCAQLPPAEH